jgi:surface antigen
MKLKKFIASLLVMSMVLSMTVACEQGPNNSLFSKQNIGTLAGAAGGAWLGSNVGGGKGKIVGIAAGTLLGAALGNSIGASLDKADMNYHNQASQSALENAPVGKAKSWSNPDSGHSGTITPTKTFQEGGTYCREYSQTINIGGKQQEGYGVACRQPDGSWKVKE